MGLIDLRVGGNACYSNEVLKKGCYKADTPASVTDPGLLAKITGEYTFDLADENGRCDGVVSTGSRDSGSGVWNIALNGNYDAILVLTTDTTTRAAAPVGSPVYVGAGGKATTTVPTVASHIIGITKSVLKTTVNCAGATVNCYEIWLEKVATPTPATTFRSVKKEV